MPEIKHTFTGGKMNKDFDERLVPKDQYRDAMNVQVMSSDGSEVGTVQNLLGNKAINLPIVKESFVLREDGLKDQIYNCVGCISDEKEDTSFWFLSGDTHSYQEVWDNAYVFDDDGDLVSMENFYVRDYIIARTFNENTKLYQQNIVFTDRKRFYSRTGFDLGFPAIDYNAKKIHIPWDTIGNLSVGDNLTAILGYNAANVQVGNVDANILYIEKTGSGGENYIILDAMPAFAMWTQITTYPFVLEFTSKCLQFNSNNLITSINIVDDLLFWTDGFYEPKVINIERSALGTDQSGVIATRLNNPTLGSGLRYVLPHDLYVIKRKPTKKLTVEYSKNKRSSTTSGKTTYNFNTSFNLFSAGYVGTLSVFSHVGTNELNYKIGDTLLILNNVDIENGNRTLPYEYDVKIVIEDIEYNIISGANEIQYKIISISTLTPSSAVDFSVVLDQRSFEKFENEMVRFSYRYRYPDKEVSAFAPFTDLIFAASEFYYTKDTAYNIGMKNIITDVKLKDFIDIENTLNIESVDLLVKFEGSPLVYIIDTIKRNQFPITTSGNVFTGEYDFNPKNIKGVLPENQMLRPWDAVPKSAISQEIIGNRIVYGNYTFSYDFNIDNLNLNIYSDTRPLYENSEPLVGLPSIKSKRNYQLGVVFLDKNGRESPVFTNNNSSVEIPKSESENSTSFSVQNNSLVPVWAKSYKYYVKDSSLPVYNMVVDSFYKAENGDYWISVPSSERNKIEEGDFLELKKGIDSDEAVQTILNTKAISIKNEVPEFIGTTWRSLGKAIAKYDFGGTTFELFQYSNHMPQKGARSIKIQREAWMMQFHDDIDPNTGVHTGFGGGNALNKEGMNDLSIVFSTNYDSTSSYIGGINRSRHYSCGRIVLEQEFNSTGAPILPNDKYNITLDEPIRDEDDWLVTSPTTIDENLVIEIFEKIRLPRPQFQGKFFVKIEAQENLKNLIAPATSSDKIVETTLHEVDVRNLAEYRGGNPILGALGNLGDSTIDNSVFGIASGLTTTSTTMDTYAEWEDVFQMGATGNGEVVPSYWFVDRLQYYRQSKEAVWAHNRIRVESMPDNSWHGQSGQNTYPYIGDWSKRYGLGVFASNPLHLIGFPEVDAQEPDGERVPYYAYHDPIGSEAEFYPGTTSVGNPSGFINTQGKYYMELSLIGLFAEMTLDYDHTFVGSFEVGGNAKPRHWKVNREATGNSAGWPYGSNPTINNNSENVKTLDYLKTENQKFKFEGGTEIFTIKSCNMEWRYNYADGQAAMEEQKLKEQGLPFNQSKIDEFVDPLNRRLTAIIEIDKNPIGYTDQSGVPINILKSTVANASTPLKLIFLETTLETQGNEGLSTANPAVFEAERVDEEKLDIYYEASDEIPVDLNPYNLARFIPIGSKIIYPKDSSFLTDVTVSGYDYKSSSSGSVSILMDNCPNTSAAQTTFNNIVTNEEQLAFITPNGFTVYLRVLDADVFGFIRRVWVSQTTIGNDCSVSLSWYNCISFGNGVESVYLKDSFNKPFINKGVKVSATIQGEYKSETKTNGLIYSGLYNENSETNNLNQFIMAEKITKEINPTYGSIQKLYARSTADGDLITLCEDRVLKILANKDALYNADGNPQLTATDNVLGQAIPYSGEYGISTNPESFASESYRCYFTDKIRGVVLRLSKDGLTPISDFGMKDWFRDHLKLSKRLIGSYDSYEKEYNITLHQHPELVPSNENTEFTVSFKENIKGWVSFKSFANMQNGLSCANDYYTYNNNHIWLHHSKDVDRNTFYNVFTASHIDVVLNDNPGIIKTFHTLNYEGSQGRYDEESSYDTYLPGTNVVQDTYASTNFKDLYAKSGWYVVELETDKERGQVRSFVEKEGKWFNYIHGRAGGTGVVADATRTSGSGGQVTGYFDNADINFQGLGTIQTTPVVGSVYGCTDATALNYDANAAYDDPLNPCVAIITGCMNPSASNYNINANTDDGSCIHPGCTDCGLYWENITGITCLTQTGTAAFDAGSINFDPNANTDDGSCTAVVLGCTDPAAFNYNSSAHMDDGSCIAVVNGCTDSTAFNYDASANTDDGSCVPVISGCTTPTALNYNASANTDDGSCNNVACNDSGAFNYNANSTANTDCLYCDNPFNTQVSHAFINNNTTNNTSLYVSWDAPTVADAIFDYGVAYAVVAADGTLGTFTDIDSTAGATSWTITGLNDNTDYMIVVVSSCWDGVGTPSNNDILGSDNIFTTSTFGGAGAAYNIPELIAGCTTSGSFNYDSSANFDDGSCIAVVNGCTDGTATNYDPLATVDDGSCIPFIYGCTDPTNLAYNPNANTDDGSCLTYAVGALAGDANDDGIVNLADLTLVINNWLQSTYNADGTPGNQPGDTNGDGIVNLADLTEVINNWLQAGSTEFTSNGGWDGLVLEQINMTENELVTDPEFNDASAWTTPPLGNDPYGNQNYAGSSEVNLNNSGLALIIAGGPLQSTWYWWSVSQDVGFVTGNTYEVSFRARQINGSGNLQLSQGYNVFFDQAITSTFTDYTVSFTAVNDNPSATGILAIGGAVSTDVFEIESVSTGTSPLPNHNCYRLYATFDLTNTDYTNHKLLQVFADEISPSVVMASADFWNGDLFGQQANLQSEVTAGAWSMYPQNEFDTWAAIGDSYNSAPTIIGDVGFGADLSGSSWSFGGTISSDAAMYRLATETPSNADANGKVLLGQFTTTGDITAINMNFRGTFTDINGDTQNWQKRDVNTYTIINL